MARVNVNNVKIVLNCRCGFYANATTGETTGCIAQTKNTFASGHDAKLKGMLTRAIRNGQQILDIHGNRLTPVQVADRFGFGTRIRKTIAAINEAAFAALAATLSA